MRIAESLTEQKHRPMLLPQAHDHFKRSDSAVFWQLLPYFRNQENDSFCSVAASTMVINAVKAAWIKTDVVSPLSQDEVLVLAQDEEWKKGVSPEGKGVPLSKLSEVLVTVFRKLGLANVSVKTISVQDTPEYKKNFEKALRELESDPEQFIIANFQLGMVTSDEKVGHFAPLAAYDAKSDKVLLFDPDTEFHQPYWAPRERLFKAMLSVDPLTEDPRGYILIRKI